MKLMQVIAIKLIVVVIVVRSDQFYETYSENLADPFIRNAVKTSQYKWPKGVIPFEFSDEYSEQDKGAVYNAFEIIHDTTCVRFVPNDGDNRTHIRFVKSEGCGSMIGYHPEMPEPSIVGYSNYCLGIPGAIQHELLHVTGLFHEQCRPDRDEHIKVFWDNIDPQYRQNFMKGTTYFMDTFGLPYDYKSLMHYPRHAFARKGKQFTMVAINNTDLELGQSEGPTFLDLEKVRRMYSCTAEPRDDSN